MLQVHAIKILLKSDFSSVLTHFLVIIGGWGEGYKVSPRFPADYDTFNIVRSGNGVHWNATPA